jgi:membrane protease YdiL (CAAX protease family)
MNTANVGFVGRKQAVFGFGLLLIFFGVRFGLEQELDQLGPYSTYFFELGFVAFATGYYRNRLKLSLPSLSRTIGDSAIGLFGGYFAYKFTRPLSITVPFQLNEAQTLLFLLLIGPLLEEALFRLAIWEPLSDLIKTPKVLIAVTSTVFSLAHFFPWWTLPDKLHSFILYQTGYVFFLGSYCGLRRQQTQSILIPILIHLCFNFGFYLGYLS